MSIKSDNIVDVIKKQNPTRKESTIKQYERQLRTLQKLFNTDNFEFLKDIDQVIEKLKDKHFTTARNFYNSIIVLLLALNHDKRFDELIEKYQKIRDELNEKYAKEQQSGKISDKQKNNFVDVSEIQKMLSKMEDEIRMNKLKKKENITRNDLNLLLGYTIFSFLLRLPTRNDMSEMKIISKTDYNKLTKKDKDINYLVKEKSKMFILLTNYKTNKTYGDKIIDVPKDLEKILKMFIKITKKSNGDILFTNFKGEPITRNGISQLLIKTSKEYLNKSISSTMMRKIILSDKFSDTNNQKKEMSNITGHNVSTMDSVYIKEQ